MEVIRHEGVGQNLNAAIVGDLPELLAERFLRQVVEEEGPIHRAGHDMVDRVAFDGGDFDPSGAHGWETKETEERREAETGRERLPM